jgi:glycosidase
VAGEEPFLIGEVFTGAGSWGVDVIRYYLGPEGLDSVFNFPLMWAIRDVLAHESAGFDAIEDMLVEVETATAGSGAVLGQIIGNHDVTRFFSEAHGDAGGDPWAAPAEQVEDAVAFARLRSALTLLLTLPGLPVLFYGDEVGLAGSNDPDNRRVLPEPGALSARSSRRRWRWCGAWGRCAGAWGRCARGRGRRWWWRRRCMRSSAGRARRWCCCRDRRCRGR